MQAPAARFKQACGKPARLLALQARGAFRPLISEHYLLERGGEAIARLANRAATGKTVVTMDA